MQRIIISAMSHDRVIGSGDGMPWHVPDEYAHFLDVVRGQTMIMGRRSWQIFGGDVATAHNIVVTHSARFPNVHIAGSLPAALALAGTFGKTIFIAGGASIYRQALDAGLVDEMYLSFIEGDYQGDTWFPPFDASAWDVVARAPHPGWEFVHYRRRSSPACQ